MNFRITILTLLALTFGCGSQPQPPAPDAATGTVTVEINAADEVQIIQVENVADGTTLESVMRSIDEVPVEMQGSGSTAFVAAIGDVATNASEGWTFKVDGEWSSRGVGQTVVHPPTTISWSFGSWASNENE